MSGLSLIKPLFKKYIHMLLVGFLALVLCDVAQLLIPTILGRGIDMLSHSGTVLADLWKPVSHILMLALVVAVMRYVWRLLIIGFSRRVEQDLRGRLYKKMAHLPPQWHLKQTSGDLMAMATNDLESIRIALFAGLISAVDTVVLGCLALVLMLSISPTVTLWVMLPLLAIPILTHFLAPRIYKLVLGVQDVFGQMTETVHEKLSGLRAIRSLGLTELALAETEKAGQLYLKKNIQLARLSGILFPFLYFISNVSLALALYFGGQETIRGQISTGDFVAFISYLSMLIWPLIALGMIFGFVQQGLASLSRLNRVFSEPADTTGTERNFTGNEVHVTPGSPILIQFKALSFQYPTRNKPALRELTLDLDFSQNTALIGPMGGGKSTLAALLPALYPAPLGTLKVDGHWVENWVLDDLRALFGYVPQDGFLFSGTIYENVAFGKPQASEAEVAAATSVAGLEEDLSIFPEKLNTVVGERGITLSGGQKQRIALARALILDPPYLILDDPLSAVDAAVEARIMGKLLAQRRSRGLLIISHRLTSLTGMDRIVVLDQGQLIEEGSPTDLLRRDSYFKRLLNLGRFGK